MNAQAKFFDETEIEETAFAPEPSMDFGFRADALMIAIDAGEALEYSFDGKNRHGKIYTADSWASFDRTDASKIWFRKVGSLDCQIRVWAWGPKS